MSSDEIYRKLIISAVVLISAFSISHISHAQQTLTLPSAIELGLDNNPRLAASESDRDAAQSRIGMARSGLLPQVNAHAAYSKTNSPMWAFATKLNQGEIRPVDFNPNNLNDPDSIDNYQAGISVLAPVFDSGQSLIGLDMAKKGEQASEYYAQRVRHEVIYEITASYARVVYAMENLAVIDRALESARARQDMVCALHDSGLVVRGDLLRANVYVAELEQMWLKAQNGVYVALAALNASMGLPVDTEHEIACSLDAGEPLEGSIEDWVSEALDNRPDLKQARMMMSVSDRDVDRARAAFLPGVYLSGSWEANTEDFEEPEYNYTLGALVNVNLFSGGYRVARVDEAEANSMKAANLTRQLELGVEVQARQAYLNAESAYCRMQVAAEAVVQAEEGLRIVADRYETGLMSTCSTPRRRSGGHAPTCW